MTSFSPVRLSAIISVRATRVLSAIFIEKHSHLFCIQSHGLSFQLDIQLGLAILALVDDDFVVQVYLLHRFMSYRKLLLAKVIYLSLRLQDKQKDMLLHMSQVSPASMWVSKYQQELRAINKVCSLFRGH